MSPRSPAQRTEANLLRIPPEVRNQIWFLTESLVPTLHHPEGNHFVPIDRKDSSKHWQQWCTRIVNGRVYFDTSGKCLPQPAITRVSSMLRKETLDIYYGNAKFYLSRYFGMGSGDLSYMYIMKWVRAQCQRLVLEGGVLFDAALIGGTEKDARRLLAPGVVCGDLASYKLKKMLKYEGNKEHEVPAADEDGQNDGIGVNDGEVEASDSNEEESEEERESEGEMSSDEIAGEEPEEMIDEDSSMDSGSERESDDGSHVMLYKGGQWNQRVSIIYDSDDEMNDGVE